MKIFIGYDELSSQVRERFNQDVTFEGITEKNLKVTYKKKTLLIPIQASVDLSFMDIKDNNISVKYHTIVGLDQVISMVLKVIIGQHPDLKDAIHINSEVCTVNLSEVKNASAFTQNFAIKDIILAKEGINILLTFK